ncbi:hypothetical protein FOA43_001511 [Brettanomyces nanus]|uniref:Uncharacterized protein n=1 Tax=Eeniella nana TaxID=13502 RepID=A0A875RU47_EENNA|nr:uncharacterized protein FOA43_001511 [Brettanomyces nanus]QPG74187.1 hypothetical protein FOA43_001511 [Brettanomyces nanus]
MFHRIDIQPDFITVVNDVLNNKVTEELIWVRIDSQSYTFKVSQAKRSVYPCVTDPEVRLTELSAHQFSLRIKGGETILLRAPRSYLLTENQSNAHFNCMDIKGEVLVVGEDTGTITCFKHRQSDLRLTTKLMIPGAHLTEVLRTAIFPSGKVALSMGLDYTIKIWSLDDGSNPRTIRGVQLKRLSDVVLIGSHGRNFVSSSLDGTACIWECGSGKCIEKFQRVKDMNDGVMSLAVEEFEQTMDEEPRNSLFFECSGKRLYCGHNSGVVSVWDLGTRRFIGEFNCTTDQKFGGVSSLAIDGGVIMVGFSKRSVVKGYRVSFLEGETVNAVCIWTANIGDQEEEQEIKRIKKTAVDTVICLSTDDLVALNLNDGQITEYFVGYDNVLNDITVKDNRVYVCGKEGLLMEY